MQANESIAMDLSSDKSRSLYWFDAYWNDDQFGSNVTDNEVFSYEEWWDDDYWLFDKPSNMTTDCDRTPASTVQGFFSGSGKVSGPDTNYSTYMGLCTFEFYDIALAAMYLFLFFQVVGLIRNSTKDFSRESIQRDRTGVSWYLLCTASLCAARCLCFSLAPFIADTVTELLPDGVVKNAHFFDKVRPPKSTIYVCDASKYTSFQWEVDGTLPVAENKYFLGLFLIILSTASTALFFTSYTYFAYSLAKVLDLLTIPNIDDRITLGAESDDEGYFFYGLLGLNGLTWGSIILLWFTAAIVPSMLEYSDYFAQMALGFSVLTISLYFTIHFLKALYFLWQHKWADEDEVSGREHSRGSQLTRLLQFRRVLGVCMVVTVCFVIRAMLLVARFHMGPGVEDIYFLFIEVVPTAFMIHAFKNSRSTLEAPGATGVDEYEVYKAELEMNVTEAGAHIPSSKRSIYAIGRASNATAQDEDLETSGLLGSHSFSNERCSQNMGTSFKNKNNREHGGLANALSGDEFDGDII